MSVNLKKKAWVKDYAENLCESVQMLLIQEKW